MQGYDQVGCPWRLVGEMPQEYSPRSTVDSEPFPSSLREKYVHTQNVLILGVIGC